MNQRGSVRLLALLLIVSLVLVANQSHWLPSIAPARAQGSTGVYITPQNITDLTKAPGSSFVVSVNVSESPPLSAFEVVVHYNNTILKVNKVDYTGSVLAGADVVIFCVDGAPPPGSPGCKNGGEGNGVVTLALKINSNPDGTIGVTPPIGAGRSLFQVQFGVVKIGLGQIHIHSVALQTAAPPKWVTTPVQPLSLNDGFFTNAECPAGGGRACKPPTVRVVVSPNPVPAKVVATFNATVAENNIGAKPLSYLWDWGDGTQSPPPQTASTNPPIGVPMKHAFSSDLVGLGNGCVAAGLCLVRLWVFDTQGVTWETTVGVVIPYLKIVLSVAGISIDNQFSVVPGTLVHITAQIVNTSTIAENATLVISLEKSKTLNSSRFSLASIGGTGSLKASWDTSNYAPRAYAIIANITSVTSAQKVGDHFITTQNDTSNSVSTTFVLLVSPLVTGALNLNILQTAGIGILILVAAIVAAARFLRKPSYETELP